MLPEIDYPDYIPDSSRDWAFEHRGLLELVVDELLTTGQWPRLSDLTRQLAREQRPQPLRSIFWAMPKPLGFMENNPERVILTPHGLRTTHAGHKLLSGLVGILRLAAERYASDDDDPTITRVDAARGTVASDPYVTALSEILLRGVPFLAGGTGDPTEAWTRKVSDDIVRYWDAVRADDYLRIRAHELAGSPQLGWPGMDIATGQEPPLEQHDLEQPMETNLRAMNTDSGDENKRDAFISHAGEDKDAIARPLAKALIRPGHTVWFDEFELTIGDSLRQEIDRGLANSRFGVVILSPAFFAKEWPQRELDGLTAREIAGVHKIILPVWHQVDGPYVARFSPPLADKLAVRSTVGVPALVEQIERVLISGAR